MIFTDLKHQVFTAWLTVPSLRAMAWEAVCHYTPHIAKLPKVKKPPDTLFLSL